MAGRFVHELTKDIAAAGDSLPVDTVLQHDGVTVAYWDAAAQFIGPVGGVGHDEYVSGHHRNIKASIVQSIGELFYFL